MKPSKFDVEFLDEIANTLNAAGHILSAFSTADSDSGIDRRTLGWLGEILWEVGKRLRDEIDSTQPPKCAPS